MILPGFPEHKIKIWIVGLLVALATVLVYLPALSNDFVNWDDDEYVYENPHIQSLDSRLLRWMFTSFHAGNWHPLTWLSHALDYALWGLKPRAHHLTSILLHGLNTFLVVILIIRLLEETEIRRRTSLLGEGLPGKVLIAGAITALLFGLHPLHVESVAWVAERKDVLCAFFFLLSLLCYLRHVFLSSHQRRFIFYGFCLLFFTMALMSKPMAVTLPMALVILDIYPLGRIDFKRGFTSQRKVWVEKLPFLGLSLASSVVTVVAQRAGGTVIPLKYLPLGMRILGSIRGLCFYLVKMVWPAGLVPLYPHPVKISLLNPEYMGALVLVIGISGFCIWQWSRQRLWSVAWAYYVVTLLPVLGIIQVGSQAAADRYAYLPSLGPFLLVGLGVAWGWGKPGRSMVKRLFIIIPSILIVTLLTNLTVKQIKVWKDSITLWNSEIKEFPDRVPVAYSNRGNAYARSGNYERAIEDYDRAIELDPQYAKAYSNRGVAYEGLGNYERAIEGFDKAIELNPQFAGAYSNRGLAYEGLGNYQRAIKDYDRAIELDPQYAGDYYNRGNAYAKLGNYQRAIKDYDRAIELDPQDVKAYSNRGVAYEGLGNHQRAIEDFDKAIELEPQDAEAYSNRGMAYGGLGNHERAIEDFAKTIELAPQFAPAYVNRGVAYAAKGQYEEAITDYKQALKIDPDNVWAYNSLGYLYIDKEIDLEEGLKLIKKALSLAPENPHIIDSLGWAYYKKGMFDEALDELERAIKLGGEDADFYEHLARVYEKKQMYEEAIKAWKKVLEISPQHREAQRSLTRLRALIHE